MVKVLEDIQHDLNAHRFSLEKNEQDIAVTMVWKNTTELALEHFIPLADNCMAFYKKSVEVARQSAA